MGNNLHYITPVVLCGGSGAPLWTSFRVALTKQSPVFSCKTPSFQQSVERFKGLKKVSVVLNDTLIVTNNEHHFLVFDQLREMKELQAQYFITCPRISINRKFE